MVQPLWKTVWNFLKKLKIELLFDPAIPILGIYLKKMKTVIQKDVCITMFTVALFTITKIWVANQAPINRWMDKEVVCIYNGILISHKNEWDLAILTTEMDLEFIMLSEISQTEKDKYCMLSLICGLLKSWTNRNRVEWWLPGAVGWGKWGHVGPRVQTSNYKMNKLWESNVKHGNYS